MSLEDRIDYLAGRLDDVEDRIIHRLLHLTESIGTIMADLSALVTEVAAIRDTGESVSAAIDGILLRLEDAENDPAQIAAAVADIRAVREGLAAAIVNIPPDPNLPTEPPDVPTDTDPSNPPDTDPSNPPADEGIPSP